RTIEPLMRAAHSLKGAARIVNLEPAVRLSHVMEDVFVAAQEGRVQLAPSGIDILLESTDVLAGLSTVAEPALPDWVARHEKIVQELESRLRGLAQAKPQGAEPAPEPAPEAPPAARPVVDLFIPAEPIALGDEPSLLDLFREEVRVNATALSQGLQAWESAPADAERISSLARAAHSLKGAARIGRVEAPAHAAATLGDARAAAQQGRVQVGPGERDVFLRATAVLAGIITVAEDNLADWASSQETEMAELKKTLQEVALGKAGLAAIAAPLPKG